MATSLELEHFLAENERRAYKHALYALHDHHAALDVVQNTMMKLVTHYADKPVAELPLLFQRILQNAIRDHFRRSKVRNFWIKLVSPVNEHDDEPHETLENLVAASTHVPSPEQLVSEQQHLALIEQALMELPLRQRQAFLLRYWEGLDVTETAAVMACSEGTVKTHSFRAVNALATRLKAMGVQP